MNKVLFFDVETSGYDKINFEDRSGCYKFQIVSVGICIVNPLTWKEIDSFYIEIKWNGYSEWDPGAEKVHKLSQEYLDEHGVDQDEAFVLLCEFIVKHFDANKQITLGGHNVSTFDRHFLIQLFNQYDAQIKLSGRAIDTYTLGKVLFGTDNSDELFEMVGVQRAGHNALEDTRLALKVVRLASTLFKQSVA